MTRAEIIRVLQLEAELARCRNGLEAERQKSARRKQRAKNKAKKVKR